MKRSFRITMLTASLLVLFSCDYDTHVLNVVHSDGSITRRVTMENSQKYFEPKRFRVPIDSTWNVEVSFELHPNNDTLWILTAEKHFNNVREINEAYKYDLGSNRYMQRSAGFSKKFKWFTTEFRYSESVEKALTVDCPISDFLTEEEVNFVYLPGKVQDDLKNGADSARYKKMNDDIEASMGKWLYTCEMRQWIDIFQDLFGNDPRLPVSRESMNSKESLFVQYFLDHEGAFDQIFEDSIPPDSLFISVLGEEFVHSFKDEITYSLSLLHDISRPVLYSDKYELEIRMPGKIFSSNGYAQTDPEPGSGEGILFTIAPEHFVTQSYECWVKSRVNNYFIWVATGLFVLIVLAGLIRRNRKR
jgi:hypothetical protein